MSNDQSLNQYPPMGQCIKPVDIPTSTSSSHLDVLDYAAKVAVTSTSTLASNTATQLLHKNSKIPRIRTTSSESDSEQILWVHIQDCLSQDFYSEIFLSKLSSPHSCNLSGKNNISSQTKKPILLYIGYTTGFSIWILAANSNAYEVISLRNGPVNHVKVLATPTQTRVLEQNRHPHYAYVAAGSLEAECELVIASLLEASSKPKVHKISFPDKVQSIKSNSKLLIISLYNGTLAGFNICSNYTSVFSLELEPFSSSSISLSSRWIAFPEKTKRAHLISLGGVQTTNETNSVTSSVLKTFSTLINLAETAYKETTKTTKGDSINPAKPEIKEAYMTIVDIDTLCAFGQEQKEAETDEHGQIRPVQQSVMFHFAAHRLTDYSRLTNSPKSPDATKPHPKTTIQVTSAEFDFSGMLLATTDNYGHVFNVFKLDAHITSSGKATVQHIYCLRRGDTECNVTAINWSFDSRLIGISTTRGTTHVFPIVPTGGCVTPRSHVSNKVVNKFTIYDRSTGMHKLLSNKVTLKTPPTCVDAAVLLRSSKKIAISFISYTRSNDTIFLLDTSAKVLQIKLTVLDSTNSTPAEACIETETNIFQSKGAIKMQSTAISQYSLRRRPEWPSLIPPLSKLSPLVLVSSMLQSSSPYTLHGNQEEKNLWVEGYLTSLHGYINKSNTMRERTSSWNFNNKKDFKEKAKAAVHNVNEVNLSTTNSLTSSTPSIDTESDEDDPDVTHAPSSINWLDQLETMTCETDKRSLSSEPQFIFYQPDISETQPQKVILGGKKKPKTRSKSSISAEVPEVISVETNAMSAIFEDALLDNDDEITLTTSLSTTRTQSDDSHDDLTDSFNESGKKLDMIKTRNVSRKKPK